MIKWLRGLWSARGKAAVSSSDSPADTQSKTQTEYSAEVVRVTQILPHPNADRLEIARFEMDGIGETTYEVVTQKGETKPGDLMAYFSVDCVVPLLHPAFKFLATRLDGAGKTHYRLRAARLRKVFSQGLLVPAPSNAKYGDQVAEAFGVTYHRDPEPVVKGPSAPTAKLKVQPMPVYGVDSLKKVPRLFEEGEAVAVTEKIHGTNFRFGWVRRRFLGIPVGWKFVVGSHRVIKGNTGGHWYGSDIWLQAAQRMELAAKTKDYKGYVFYGELFGFTYDGQKIQDLTYGRTPQSGPGLVIFDVRDVVKGCWLGFMDRWDTVLSVGLEPAPILATNAGYVPLLGPSYEGQDSRVDEGTMLEGVVIESLGGPRRKAKYVTERYLTR